jgi:hypothetical protein
MAKWILNSFDFVSREKYDALLKQLKELQLTVKCDYYEAYLLEKKRKESLEQELAYLRKDSPARVEESEVHNVAGWEYYDLP